MLSNLPYRPNWREMRPAVGVGAGMRSQITIQPGMTIQQIQLKTNVNDPAHIEKVELEINGETPIFSDGAATSKCWSHTKNCIKSRALHHPLCALEAKTSKGVQSGELVTEITDTITLWVTFSAAASGTDPVRPLSGNPAPTAPRIYASPVFGEFRCERIR